MKRIIKWLKTQLSRGEALAVTDPLNNSESVKPEDDDYTVETSFGIPVPNAVMPDKHADEYVDTVPILKLEDRSSPDTDKSTGFDPYDTVKLHKK